MTHRQTLRELAHEYHGVVTVRDAERNGVPGVEVRKLASRGALTRLGHGVYLMTEAPTDELTEFAAAVALVGRDGILVDESVLAAHDLAQVNLRRIKVATLARIRRQLPPTVEIVRRHVAEHDELDGIPVMRLGDALLSSRGAVMPSRLVDAARTAAARGLIDHEEAMEVINELEDE